MKLCHVFGKQTGINRGGVIGMPAEDGGVNWTVRVVIDCGTHRADIARIIRTLQAQFDLEECPSDVLLTRYHPSRKRRSRMPTPEYCLLEIEWWPLCMTKSEWSGWTQAIFSVIAIGAAACIAGWQYFAARSAANEGTRIRERARAIAMFELARRVHALTYAAKRGVEERKPGHLKWPIAEVERLRRIVERLPVLDLSSVPLITAFRDMDKVMNVVVEVCAAHMRTPTDGDRTAALQSLGGAQNLIRAAVDGCVTEVEMLTRKHDVAFSDPWFQRMHQDT